VCIITRGNPGELYFPRGPPRELNRSSPILDSSESKDAEDHIGADNWPAISSPRFSLSLESVYPAVLFVHFSRSFRGARPGNVLIKSNRTHSWRIAFFVPREKESEEDGVA